MASDKRGIHLESKLPDLFVKAEALASEVQAEHEERTVMRRQEESESRRRYELERRIRRLDHNVALHGVAPSASAHIFRSSPAEWEAKGPISPESDAAKWLAWARRYADSIDPTCRSTLHLTPQELWE